MPCEVTSSGEGLATLWILASVDTGHLVLVLLAVHVLVFPLRLLGFRNGLTRWG